MISLGIAREQVGTRARWPFATGAVCVRLTVARHVLNTPRPRTTATRCLTKIRAQISGAAPMSANFDVTNAVHTLEQAAKSSAASPKQVLQALRELEKAKLPTDGWPEIVGGSSPPGRRWRLVFTSGVKEVRRAMKKAGQGGGTYFPLTAVQRWDAANGEIENGVFLGHIAALKFSGPYVFKGKRLIFDFDTLKLRLGPAHFQFPLKKRITSYQPSPKDPFFIVFYVDDNFIAARGRSGGVAFWARTNPEWELQHGVF